MTTNPAILSALLQITANPGIFVSSPQQPPLNIPISADTITDLKVLSGQYTPNDDFQIIATGLAGESPDFICLIVDGPAVLSSDNNMLAQLPVGKVFLTTLLPLKGGALPIDELRLDGAAANPYPMAQNVLLNWTLILGQANIT